MPILVKAGDTAPTVQATLLDAAGDPVDLVDATCRFIMARAETHAVAVDAPALVRQNGSGLDGSKGTVEYAWAVGDTTSPGIYLAEFEIVYASGAVQSFPTEGFIDATVTDDLGGTV